MLKNYIKVAWRSLKKQPFFTFLNTFGLAIGMAGCILIGLYIYDELSYDKMFADADRIHRIDIDVKFGGEAQESAEASAPMAKAMENDFPQVETTTRFRNLGSMLVRKSNVEINVKELGVTYVDASFFKMFGIELLYGNAETALSEPNTLVLTRTAAEKHFGINRAVGETLILDNTDTYTVVGVIDDLPQNSFLRGHSVFLSMTGYEDAFSDDWGSHNYFTFVKLIPGADSRDFQAPLQSMFGKYLIPYAQAFYPGITEAQFLASGNYLNYSTIALTDIHLHSNKETELSANGTIQNIYILSFIGIFLIVLASVNFMNLSTAHSLKRAKEVGVRKTLGSNKSDLIRQFLTESGLITSISLVFAIVLVIVTLPIFNSLSGSAISIPFTNPFFWGLLIVTTMVLGFLSGCYPAFFMSRFIPVKVLKGNASHLGGGNIRNSLVVFQFTISILLIVGTLVVFQQLQFIQNKDLGFTKDQVLIIDDVYAAESNLSAFKEEVQKLAQVTGASVSGYLPTPSFRSSTSFFKEGISDQENTINMQFWTVDHDYLSTLNMQLIAGRDFDRQFSNDSTALILNESAVSILDVEPEEALGMRLSRDFTEENAEFSTVIGVVKNFHFESLHENISALSFRLGNSNGAMIVKLKAGDFSAAISKIERLWKDAASGQDFNFRFMDDTFNSTYEAEQRLGRIFIAFTILSVLIACLGLFGLAAFNAEKRTKEIGVRKVLGASVRQISYSLTRDFLKLVGIAILIALPVGWYIMNRWLEGFSYRTEISWEVFATATCLAVLISIVTVSYQSIKAAIMNPVKSLRAE